MHTQPDFVSKVIYTNSHNVCVGWIHGVDTFFFFPVSMCILLLNENNKKLHKMYIVDCYEGFPVRAYLWGISKRNTKHENGII